MAVFNIGDRVQTPYDYGNGIVCSINGDSIGVHHDTRNSRLHSLSGECPTFYGWFYNAKQLVLLEKAVPKSKKDLIIEKIKYLDYKFKMRNTVLKESEPDGYDEEEWDEEEEDYDDSDDEEVASRWG